MKILKSAGNGFPLLRDIKEAIAPPKGTDGKPVKDEGPILRLLGVLVTLGSVWLVCYLANKYGLTLEDITNLFGLLK